MKPEDYKFGGPTPPEDSTPMRTEDLRRGVGLLGESAELIDSLWELHADSIERIRAGYGNRRVCTTSAASDIIRIFRVDIGSDS